MVRDLVVCTEMKRADIALFIIKRNNMETIIDILMWLFFSATVIVVFLIIGDGIATKFPKSRFKKWWRSHIVSENPYDSN
jgi:hypothetical protein